MALRAFQFNPSLGGFGNESRLRDVALPSSTGDNNHARGSAGAFAQIVKELVDNAVDACSTEDKDNAWRCGKLEKESPSKHVYKRVRVKIESEEFVPNTSGGNDNDAKMDCLRITVSDNGVGMKDIDACVMVFSSNKNGSNNQLSVDCGESNSKIGASRNGDKSNKSKNKSKKQGKPSSRNESITTDGYTTGRYGLGLTLCLLHAQHLVPGSVTCITSATSGCEHWIRSTYSVDTEADRVLCEKREEIEKGNWEDCGTIVSLLVPGGIEAQNQWPRLAEYFARFQLSPGLSCSLEVLAPSLSRRPLMIRPPSEVERKGRLIAAQETKDDDADSEADRNLDWDGDDGLDSDDDVPSNNENTNLQTIIPTTHISKATREREQAQAEKAKKISLLCKAAEMYKGRPVSVKNVAIETHPIRRHGSSTQSNRDKNSLLEVSIVVFGPEPDDASSDDDCVHDQCTQSQNKTDKSASLQLIRMVNGIPLLDSPEAVACGIVQKISNNGPNWNSFGLDVSLKTVYNGTPGDDTPTFNMRDSAQVAPFFRESAHSLFHDKSRQEDDESSSDDDTFDPDNITRKRKKERSCMLSLLPASLRLGEVLMIAQIRAKPSALPLPTLSKGRLPLNDKGINDALENGITSCLRSLQKTNSALLLTAHQLKRVERDAKYVPSVAGAIASVLCRSKQRGLYEHAMSVMSGWDGEVKKLGIPPFDQVIQAGQRTNRRGPSHATNPSEIAHEREVCKVEALRPLLERRLRFVVSEEFKDSKKEKIRKEREDEAAVRKKERAREVRRQRRALETDGMNSDCFGSDHSVEHKSVSRSIRPSHSDFESEVSSPEMALRRRFKHDVIDKNTDRSDTSDSGYNVGHGKRITGQTGAAGSRSPANFDSNDGFDSEAENAKAAPNPASVCKTDGISSDDDWSNQYGMVVPGSFFR